VLCTTPLIVILAKKFTMELRLYISLNTKIGYFRDVLISQSLSTALKILNLTQHKHTLRINQRILLHSYNSFSFLLANMKNYMLSPIFCRLSSVCNTRASYSGGSNFCQYFYGIRYLGHPLTSTENFTEIVRGEPLHRGS